MKKFILLFVIALLPMLAVAQVADSKYLITSEGVGVFLAGQKIPTKLAGYKITKSVETITTEGEGFGYKYDVYTVWENGQKILNIENHREPMTADNINILSNKFKTSKNIGVGSTIDEFIAAYSDYKLLFYCLSDMYVDGCKQGWYLIEAEQLQNVQFELDGNDFLGGTPEADEDDVGTATLTPSDFKKGTTIMRVRIY